ncbi:MAG: ATP-dependent zinc metalloprotease FtsH [Mycoplasma sp.]|nr:ATP-dependent zinc metalloprotease FtsH [Mycoplasma sp.]
MNYTNRSNRRSSKKWLKWFIFILVLGGIITLIWYFSTDHYVNVRNVSRISLAQDGNKQKITIERNKGKELTASSNEISDLISAEYYVTGGNKTSYHLYISNTNIGKLSIGLVDYFKLGEIKTENNQGILTTIHYMNIGGWSISYAEYNGNYYTQNGEQWALLNDKILNDKNLIILYKAFSNALTTATIPSSSNIGYILLQLLPTVIIVGLFVWYFSKMSRLQGGGEESIWSVGKSQAKLAKSKYKFSDVAGLKEEKDELIEIVDYLKNPNKYAAMGARVPKGVILYGPPGTGKTLLAKAVAGEAKVPFYQVSGSSFEDMLVGVGAKRVRDLFNNAKKSAPSIIFIDELDSVAAKRGRADVVGPSAGIADQTINQLLAEMDGFDTKSGVVIIAATNRLDVLDEAILRPGRFDRHVQINLPDIKERELILQIHAKNKNISSKVNLNDIARRTPGFSGAQLENVLNEATLLTVRNNKTAVGMEEIDEAIDRVIAGPAKHSRVITEAEKKQIAYHEAGHALVGLNLPGSDVVEKITIIPRGQAAGYTLSTPEKQEITIQKKSDLLAIIASTLAGRAAEEIVYGKENISTGAANDLFKVTKITKSMVTQLGMTELGMTQLIPSEGIINPYSKQYSEQTAQKIDAVVEKIIQKQYAKAKQIIEKNRKELDLIVDALLVLETIVKSQIDYIHKNKKLPNEVLEKKKNYV